MSELKEGTRKCTEFCCNNSCMLKFLIRPSIGGTTRIAVIRGASLQELCRMPEELSSAILQ